MEEQKTNIFQHHKISFFKWAFLIVCAYSAQAVHYPIFGDISFAFGSVFLLIILRRFGFAAAMGSLFLTFPASLNYQGLFYQSFIVFEFAVLYELLKRYPKENIVFLDAIYWLLIGSPLYLLIHTFFLDMPFSVQGLGLLSLTVNALFCALISGLLIQVPAIRKFLGFQQNQNRFYLKQAIFNLLILFLMLPVLTVTLYNAHKQEKAGLKQVHYDINNYATVVENNITSWLEDKQKNIKQLNIHVGDDLEQKLSLNTYIRQALIVDGRMNVLASYRKTEDDSFFENLTILNLSANESIFQLQMRGDHQAIIFKTPLMLGSKIEGTLLVAYDISSINQILKSALSDKVVLRMKDDNSGQLLFESGLAVFDDFRLGKIQEQEEGLFLWHPPIRFNHAADQDLYFKEYKFDKFGAFTFLVALPVVEYRAQIENSYITHLLILMGFISVALVFAQVASRRVVEPLEKLSEMSSHLPDRIRNRQPVYWPETSLIEVSSLLNSYKKMSEAMLSNVSKLEDTKRQLEDRVVAEEYARHSIEKQAEQMLNKMMDGVLVVLSTGNIFFANRKIEEFLELDMKAIETLKFDQIFAESDHQKLRYEVAQRLKKVANKGVNIKTVIHQKHKHFPVDVSINPIEVEGETAVFLSFRDMGRYYEMQESLAKTEGKFYQILQALGDPVLILDKKCLVLDANPAAAMAFDVELDKFKNSELSAYVQENRKIEFKEIFSNLLESENNFMSFEMTFISSDNKYLSFDVSVNVVEAEGVDACFILVCRDLSTYKFVQKELYRARNSLQEALEAKAHFLGNMSHELRTPMNTIVNMVDEVNRKVDDKELAGYTERLDKASDSLLELVNDMFEHAQMDMQHLEFAKEPVDLPALIKQVSIAYVFHAEDKGMKIDVAIDSSVPEMIISDGTRLKQILLKLISVIIRTTASGNLHIHVGVKEQEQQQSLISFEIYNGSKLLDTNYVQLVQEILQNPAEALSEKHKNIGLGLVVVSQLVDQMGLTLIAEHYRDGIRFKLEGLFNEIQKKASSKELVSFEDMEKELKNREEPAKILVVDDSSDNRFIINMLLKPLAVEVVEVANGEEAIEVYKEKDFDVVLMDMLMPVMDGYEATAELKKIQQKEDMYVPIIALTANALKEDEEKCIEAGCDAYLSKPIKKEGLYEKIYAALSN